MLTPGLERVVGLVAAFGQARCRPSGPSAIGQVMSIVCARKTSVETRAQRLELVVAQDRLVHHELVGVLGRLVEQVALGADAGAQRHDDRLADRVDRRVGDLREELLEVGEQRRAVVGEDGERVVVAHRADRLLAVPGHRRDQDAQVLLRVAERELALAQRQLALADRRRRLEVVEVHDVAPNHSA